MEEKLLKEILDSLLEIKSNLKIPYWPGHGGDPAPEMDPRFRGFNPYIRGMINIRGPIADNGPEQLLDKDKLAKLKVARIESLIDNLNKEIEGLNLEVGLLKQQYKFK
jgi:hypothetical protein